MYHSLLNCAGTFGLALALWLASGPGPARAETVAVLDFELDDLTPHAPGDPVNWEEVARTAELRPLLARALAERVGDRMVEIVRDDENGANSGFTDLWDDDGAAARLGRGQGADWVVVGRHYKAGSLAVQIQAHLIDARNGALAGDFAVESNGRWEQAEPRGIEHLAEQIAATLKAQRLPAAKARHGR